MAENLMAYTGFKKLEGELADQPGVTNPGALAATIGKRKYGVQPFNKAAATGTSLKGKSARHKAISASMRRHMKR